MKPIVGYMVALFVGVVIVAAIPGSRPGSCDFKEMLHDLTCRCFNKAPTASAAMRCGWAKSRAGLHRPGAGWADVLAVAYKHAMTYKPEDPELGRSRPLPAVARPLRDRALRGADRGRIVPEEELETYGSDDSRLPMSGMVTYTPGMEMSVGRSGKAFRSRSAWRWACA
jgi:hypothetical protein